MKILFYLYHLITTTKTFQPNANCLSEPSSIFRTVQANDLRRYSDAIELTLKLKICHEIRQDCSVNLFFIEWGSLRRKKNKQDYSGVFEYGEKHHYIPALMLQNR